MGNIFKGIVKMLYKDFPQAYLGDTIKDLPGDTHLVVQSDNTGNVIQDIGYNYNSMKVLIFISTPVKGSYFPVNPYEGRWHDRHFNIHVHFFLRPPIISSLFDHSNVIGMYIHDRQCELTL